MLLFLMEKVARLNRNREWGEISLVLMDNEGIIPVNAAHLSKSNPTDVISFAYPPMPGTEKWIGEVLVNAQRAIEEGGRRGDIPKELALYIAHGCDHLSGADDSTDVLRRRMRRRELRWLREIKPL